MNICHGPLEYLTAFAFVLATGVLLGLGLGWNFCCCCSYRGSSSAFDG